MFRRPSHGPVKADPVKTIAEVAAGEVVLIDVREPAEVAASGKAKGALHIPLAALRMRVDPTNGECADELRTGKPVVLYCASGARSQNAGLMMLQLGYPDVRNLGSIRDWVQAGGPLER